MLWFVAPRDAIGHGAVIGSVKTKDERGDPGSLKNIGSHLAPCPIPEKPTFPLCTAPLWDLSLDMKTHGLYVFPWLISCHTFTYKCRKGGLGCCNTMTTSLHSLSAYCGTLSHFHKEASHSLDISMSVRVENQCFYHLFKPHKSFKPGEMYFCFKLNTLWNKSVPSSSFASQRSIIKGFWSKLNILIDITDTLPNNSSAALLEKRCQYTQL